MPTFTGDPMRNIVTWYDVLGVLPDAPLDDIRQACQARWDALAPATLAGAPPDVVTAADKARQAVTQAWQVLADQAARESYDVQVGIEHPGEGLAPDWRGPSGPDVMLSRRWSTANAEAAEPFTGPSHWVVVPDVSSLFYGACMDVAGRVGLHVSPVRLTEHPMPVDGLVVSQAPAPGQQARRDSTLTVHVWHPSEPGD